MDPRGDFWWRIDKSVADGKLVAGVMERSGIEAGFVLVWRMQW